MKKMATKGYGVCNKTANWINLEINYAIDLLGEVPQSLVKVMERQVKEDVAFHTKNGFEVGGGPAVERENH